MIETVFEEQHLSFKFRFETLLRLRQRHVEAAEVELASLLEKSRSLSNSIAVAAERLRLFRHDLDRRLQEGLPAEEYHLCIMHMETVKDRMDNNIEELTALQDEIRKARYRLNIRYREKKMVEKLRQRDLERYLNEKRLKEQKEADSLSTIRHAWKQKNGEKTV